MAEEPPTADQTASDSDRERAESRRSELSEEIAQRYSPDRLTKLVVEQAGRGERLDLGTQQEMERRVGGQFSNVRVFRGPFAEAVTRRHRADAVTVANTGMILVREGPRSDPRTALGKALLAHELTHVRQAQRGLKFALELGQSSHAEHEQEAEAKEKQIHDEETGRAGGDQSELDRASHRAELHRLVKKRVFDLISEAERLHHERLGRE